MTRPVSGPDAAPGIETRVCSKVAEEASSASRSGSLLSTVAISLAISILSFVVTSINVYWTALRPASIAMTFTLVAETDRGSRRIVIPTSISNSGAQPATILNAKLIESEPGRQSLWGAEFAAPVSGAIDVINGLHGAGSDASLFVPFLVPPNEQVQTVLVFLPSPLAGFSTDLLARGGKTLRYTIILSTTAGDVTIARNVTWPGVTDGALDKAAFGVAAATDDVNRWFSDTTPLPEPSPGR